MEITTLKDLKSAVDQLKIINNKKREIFRNDDLSKNQMNKQWAKLEPQQKELENLLSRYMYIFDIKKKDLNLEKIFKDHNLDIVFDTQFLQTESTSEGFYRDYTFYDVIFKETMEVRYKDKTETVKLIHFNESSCHYYDEMKFYMGDYLLNALHFLTEDKYECSSILQEACWKAIANKYQQKRKSTIQTNEKNKNLLIQKLDLLRNEQLRNEEIALLENKISIINQETKLIENDELNVNI